MMRLYWVFELEVESEAELEFGDLWHGVDSFRRCLWMMWGTVLSITGSLRGGRMYWVIEFPIWTKIAQVGGGWGGRI